MLRSLAPTLSTFIAILLFFFYTQPKYEDIKVVQNEVTEYKTAIQSYDTFHTTLDERVRAMNERPLADREKLSALLPESIDDAKLLVDLEAMAIKHNLLFGNVSTKAQKETPAQEQSPEDEYVEGGAPKMEYSLMETDVTFDVIGTYEQLKSFLTDLERSLTIFDVVDMKFTAGEGEFQQFSLTVRSYSLSQ